MAEGCATCTIKSKSLSIEGICKGGEKNKQNYILSNSVRSIKICMEGKICELVLFLWLPRNFKINLNHPKVFVKLFSKS